jgi:hypothetical protein
LLDKQRRAVEFTAASPVVEAATARAATEATPLNPPQP